MAASAVPVRPMVSVRSGSNWIELAVTSPRYPAITRALAWVPGYNWAARRVMSPWVSNCVLIPGAMAFSFGPARKRRSPWLVRFT